MQIGAEELAMLQQQVAASPSGKVPLGALRRAKRPGPYTQAGLGAEAGVQAGAAGAAGVQASQASTVGTLTPPAPADGQQSG
eukprot:13541243-Alexandrium_andersonii.AAC.1